MSIKSSALIMEFRRAEHAGDEEFFTSMSAADIARLPAWQILKLIEYLNEPAFGRMQSLKLRLREKMGQGILDNDSMRLWYADRLKVVQSMAQNNISYVWKGDFSTRFGRINEAYKDLKKKSGVADFFAVTDLVHEALNAKFDQAGLRNLDVWRRNRFMTALFPRKRTISQIFKVYGHKESLQSFRTTVEHTVKFLPGYLHHFLQNNGYMFRLAFHLGDIDPKYVTQESSYARGKTIEETAMGIHLDNLHYIDLPERRLFKKNGKTRSIPAHNGFEELSLTTAHEVAHGLVNALGYISATDPQIVQAYKDDLKEVMASADRNIMLEHYTYFMPKGCGGLHADMQTARDETLVECMAELMIRKSRFVGGKLHTLMPRMGLIALKVLETLQADYAVNPTGVEFPRKAQLDLIRRQSYVPRRAARRYGYTV